MDSAAMGIGIVVVTTFVSVAGLLVFRRAFRIKTLDQHNHIADPFLSLVGTLFSVMLGFLVAGAIDRYVHARQDVSSEANAIADVFRLARGITDDQRRVDIRNGCRTYCLAEIEHEWKSMQNRRMNQSCWDAHADLWDQVVAVVPKDEREAGIHGAMLDAMLTAGENRSQRALLLSESTPVELFLVTFAGSCIIIIFTYLFSAPQASVQAWMVGLVAASLALNIFLLSAFSQPFAGVLRIKPEPFELNVQLFCAQDDKLTKYLLQDRRQVAK